jgi:hypothetical protein
MSKIQKCLKHFWSQAFDRRQSAYNGIETCGGREIAGFIRRVVICPQRENQDTNELTEVGSWGSSYISNVMLAFFFFFFLVGLGFELRALHLQSRHSTALGTSPLNFDLVILEKEILRSICQGWP